MLNVESVAEPMPADASKPAAIAPERETVQGAGKGRDQLFCALAFAGIAALTLAWSAILVVGAFRLIFG